MYICNNCDHDFPEPESINDWLDAYEQIYEPKAVCPFCKVTDFQIKEEEESEND